MLAMVAAAAAEDRALVSRTIEGRLRQNGIDPGVIVGTQGRDIGADAAGGKKGGGLVHVEQFRDEPPHPVEPVLHPPAAFVGTVAEPDHLFVGELLMIGDFFHGLLGDLC